MNPYNTYTDAQRLRDTLEWETSDGADYVAGSIEVREAVTDAEREEFRIAWEALQR